MNWILKAFLWIYLIKFLKFFIIFCSRMISNSKHLSTITGSTSIFIIMDSLYSLGYVFMIMDYKRLPVPEIFVSWPEILAHVRLVVLNYWSLFYFSFCKSGRRATRCFFLFNDNIIISREEKTKSRSSSTSLLVHTLQFDSRQVDPTSIFSSYTFSLLDFL